MEHWVLIIPSVSKWCGGAHVTLVEALWVRGEIESRHWKATAFIRVKSFALPIVSVHAYEVIRPVMPIGIMLLTSRQIKGVMIWRANCIKKISSIKCWPIRPSVSWVMPVTPWVTLEGVIK